MMNNEAFRRFINTDGSGNKGDSSRGKTGTKSTKEIAREAVEEEFNERRRKRGRDEDYLSDASDDDDEDDNKSHKNEKKDAEDAAKEEQEKEKKVKKVKYRNRAKERRDGKSNLDYQDSSGIATQLDEEMSKYMGGDEAYTHLVKGLDKTLADRVRRECKGPIQQNEDLDLDKIMEEASSANARERKKMKMAPKSISDLVPKQSTRLTSGMLSYLQKQDRIKNEQAIDSFGYKKSDTISQAGDSLSRTTLTFSLKANIGDRFSSWELPEEIITSSTQHERIRNGSAMMTCTPVDKNLISKIKAVFSAVKRGNASTDVKLKTDERSKTTANKTEKTIHDSDDDIFGDIGDYVPPTK